MPASEVLQLGGAVALAMASLELAKLTVGKLLNGKSPGGGQASALVCPLEGTVRDIHTTVQRIDSVQSVRDPDGTPLIYAPRGIQQELLDEVRHLVRTQEQTNLLLQQLLDR